MNAPDLTANQMIWMFWGGLSRNARAAATEELHKRLRKCPQQSRFHNPDPQTPAPAGTEGPVLSSLLFFVKLGHDSAEPSPAEARNTACPDPHRAAPRPGSGPRHRAWGHPRAGSPPSASQALASPRSWSCRYRCVDARFRVNKTLAEGAKSAPAVPGLAGTQGARRGTRRGHQPRKHRLRGSDAWGCGDTPFFMTASEQRAQGCEAARAPLPPTLALGSTPQKLPGVTPVRDRPPRGERLQVKDRSGQDMPAPPRGDGRTELVHGLGSSGPSGARSGDRHYGTARPVLFPVGKGLSSHHTQPKPPMELTPLWLSSILTTGWGRTFGRGASAVPANKPGPSGTAAEVLSGSVLAPAQLTWPLVAG